MRQNPDQHNQKSEPEARLNSKFYVFPIEIFSDFSRRKISGTFIGTGRSWLWFRLWPSGKYQFWRLWTLARDPNDKLLQSSAKYTWNIYLGTLANPNDNHNAF